MTNSPVHKLTHRTTQKHEQHDSIDIHINYECILVVVDIDL